MKKKNLPALLLGIAAALIVAGTAYANYGTTRSTELGWEEIYQTSPEGSLTNALDRYIYFGTAGDTGRLWKVVGREEDSLVLMQVYISEYAAYDSLGSNVWKNSEIYRYLNQGEYLNFFSEPEKSGVKQVEVSVRNENGAVVSANASENTLFYLPGVVQGNLLTWSSGTDNDDKKLLGGKEQNIALSLNDKAETSYWLRSPKSDKGFQALYVGQGGFVYSGLNVRGSSVQSQSQYTAYQPGVRPLLKIDMDTIIFLTEITEASVNYPLQGGTEQAQYYKLTLPGGTGDANPYKLGNLKYDGLSPDENTPVAVKDADHLDLTASPSVNNDDFSGTSIWYKIGKEDDGENIVAYGMISSEVIPGNNNLRIPLSGLEDGVYFVNIWLQKDIGKYSNEASAPVTFRLEIGDITPPPTEENEYLVKVTYSEGGLASADKTKASAGETVSLSAKAKAGFVFDGWVMIEGNVSVENLMKETISFIMPESNIHMEARFKLKGKPAEEEKMVESVVLKADKTVLYLNGTSGNTAILTASIEPVDAKGYEVQWSSSNPTSVQLISDGMTAHVTGHLAGSSQITVTIINKDGSKVEESLLLTVKQSSNSGGSSAKPSGTKSSTKGTASGSSAVTGKWIQDSTGWWYQNADGTYPASSWFKYNDTWYYFNSAGYMCTGWVLYQNQWYYLNADGSMAAGKWIFYKEKWYYVGSDGAMFADTITPDGYRVGADGAWISN